MHFMIMPNSYTAHMCRNLYVEQIYSDLEFHRAVFHSEISKSVIMLAVKGLNDLTGSVTSSRTSMETRQTHR